MAILFGTQSNGETLPVLVDQFGNLIAKGIEGQPGAPGAPGEPGPPGGSFPLPPDPYEGAVLGWFNNELAWIGTPPIPVPPGRFGHITAWDPAGLLTVAGEIPEQVKTGVYVYQCNEDGSIYVDGWNTSQVWSDGLSECRTGDEATKGFDGNESTNAVPVPPGETITFTGNIPSVTTFRIKARASAGASDETVTVTGTNLITTVYSGDELNKFVDIPVIASGQAVTSFTLTSSNEAKLSPGICQLEINDDILVDDGEYPTAPNLNLRVQSVSGQNLIGTANRSDNFTPGKYLMIPQQNVARWLYDGTLNKLITTTDIDNPRLTEN